MLKMRKLLTLMLSLCIILSSVVMPVSVMAADSLEISYWNADNSAIHLEFNGGKAVANLADYLTIKEDGKVVSYTIKETVKDVGMNWIDYDQVKIGGNDTEQNGKGTVVEANGAVTAKTVVIYIKTVSWN